MIYIPQRQSVRIHTWLPKKLRCTVQSSPPISSCPPFFCPTSQSCRLRKQNIRKSNNYSSVAGSQRIPQSIQHTNYIVSQKYQSCTSAPYWSPRNFKFSQGRYLHSISIMVSESLHKLLRNCNKKYT